MGGYRVVIKPSAAKELDRIPKRDLVKILGVIHGLAEEPRGHGSLKLAGEERYRVRQGDYRVLYEIDDAEHAVVIVKVGHRREVYR